MKAAAHIENLDRQGTGLADAASMAGLDAAVPTCPGWQIRDLLRHTGAVHRWATAFLVEGHTSVRPLPEGPAPDVTDPALLSWFRDGHAALVGALRAAPADLDCWTFLRGSASPVEFWARRQAHETTIHRVDAEYARGGHADGISPELAADGIDELLAGFHGRRSSAVRTDAPRVLRVRTQDTGEVWTVRLSDGPPVTARDASGRADCELSGPAVDMYLALWNRLPFPAVRGDAALARLWRERSGIA